MSDLERMLEAAKTMVDHRPNPCRDWDYDQYVADVAELDLSIELYETGGEG
jgi:hypothetical protein